MPHAGLRPLVTPVLSEQGVANAEVGGSSSLVQTPHLSGHSSLQLGGGFQCCPSSAQGPPGSVFIASCFRKVNDHLKLQR